MNTICYYCEEEIHLVNDIWRHVDDDKILCETKATPSNIEVESSKAKLTLVSVNGTGE